jgi:hypothetical protein
MTWSPIRTHDPAKDTGTILVALVRDGKVYRVSEATHNGFGYYDVGGYACHWVTHWMPMPKVGYAKEHKPDDLRAIVSSYLTDETAIHALLCDLRTLEQALADTRADYAAFAARVSDSLASPVSAPRPPREED